MRNDLATEITGRVKKLLDGLSAIRASKRLSVLPLLGQRLYTRYSDWVDGLLSRLYSPLSSAFLFSRSSNFQLLPLSYAWFDRRWNERRKRSRSFWSQSGKEKDEDRQMPPVPEHFFEEGADEDIVNQPQCAQSEPVYNIILNLPTLRTLPTGNMEFTRAGQLAKRIALRLEPLTTKGFHTPWRTLVEATHVPYYPGMAANDSLLDEVKGTIVGQRSSRLEEIFHPSGPMVLSPPGLYPVWEQYVGAALIPVPAKFPLAERTQIQPLYPTVPSWERMSLSFEPSGDLPIAPDGQPTSEARIGSLSYLSETPSVKSNNILVRRIFSRLQSLFGTRFIALSTNLMGEAVVDYPSYLSESPQVASDGISAEKELADSPSYLFEPPQVISDAVRAGKARATPILLPEESHLLRRGEIPVMTGVDGGYFGSLFSRPPLDRTLGRGQPSPVHGSSGHVPPSLTGEGISQETSAPAKSVASAIKSNAFSGYGQGTTVGLALAPVGRQRENASAAPSSEAGAGQEGAPEAAGETMAALDPEALASEVYSILKHRLVVEKERTTSAVA
jgi:hypothetical protein